MSESLPGTTGSQQAAGVLPRWEWRTFEHKSKLWQDALKGATQSTVLTLRNDTYLVSAHSMASVKLRGDQLEVKELMQVSEAGLEYWRSSLVTSFPLSSENVAVLCDAWRCSCPPRVPALPTNEDLLSFVSGNVPEVRLVPVKKWQRPLEAFGCVGERVTLLVGGSLVECLAFASSDPLPLEKTLLRMGLARERNTNYVQMIRRGLGWPDLPGS